jgi:hypothetical protein
MGEILAAAFWLDKTGAIDQHQTGSRTNLPEWFVKMSRINQQAASSKVATATGCSVKCKRLNKSSTCPAP